MRIDNAYDKSRLYVSDYGSNKLTVWNTGNGIYISNIQIDCPDEILFTRTSLIVGSRVLSHEIINNQVIKIHRGGNCIFEVDKESLVIKRRIMGNWYSPHLISLESNGSLNIAARHFDNNINLSEMSYFLTIDLNGKIIKKYEILKF